MPKSKYGNNFGAVRVLIDQGKVAMQDKLAQKAVEIAQRNAPRDTGFYADHIVAITSAGAGQTGKVEYRVNKKGQRVKREATATSGTAVAYSAIVAQAKYSIYVELRYQVIAKAQAEACNTFPDIVATVRQQYFGS